MSSLIRVQQSTQVVLEHTFEVDEVVTDATGPVTYAFKRLDGTAVVDGTAGHAGAGQPYTAVLPGANTQLLDTYTLDWEGTVAGAPVKVRDYVEICGGFLFGLGEARKKKPPLDATKYPTAELAANRVQVEQACERICGVAFVPRFKRVKLSGRGTRDLVAPDFMLRAIRAILVDGIPWGAMDVSGVSFTQSGVLTRLFGSAWPRGAGNIIIEYECGHDFPPPEISTAAIVHLRSSLGQFDTSVPYRAISFQAAEGGTYRLSTPSKERTGIPAVDAVYEGYRLEMGAFA